MGKLISIIVPVYKVESFIARCIESVLRQTYSKWELLLINDGSPDHSGEICQSYAKQDRRIKYFEQENQGVSVARNVGIKRAKGEIISFLDADDYIAKEMCEKIVKYWDESLELLIFDFREIYPDGRNIHRHFFQQKHIDFRSDQKYDKDFLSLSLLMFYQDWDEKAVHTFAVPWGRAYAKKFLEDNQLYFPEKVFVSEDRIFNLRCVNELNYAKYISVPLYCYCINDQSITNTMYNGDITNLVDNFQKVFKKIKSIIRLKKDARYLEAYAHFILNTLIQMLWWKPNEKEIQKRKKYDRFCCKYMNDIYKLGIKSFSVKEKVLIMCYKYKLYFLPKLYVQFRRTIHKLEIKYCVYSSVLFRNKVWSSKRQVV